MYFRDGNFESASLHVSLHVDLASSASVASWIYWVSLAAVASWISLASYILGFVEEQWLVCFFGLEIHYASRFPPRPFGIQCRSALRDCSAVCTGVQVLVQACRDEGRGFVSSVVAGGAQKIAG